jgi:hypothetical protein
LVRTVLKPAKYNAHVNRLILIGYCLAFNFAWLGNVVLAEQQAHSAHISTAPIAPLQQLYRFRVLAKTNAAVRQLFANGFDVLETRDGDYVFVIGDARTAQRLRGLGIVVENEFALNPIPKTDSAQPTTPHSFFGGYRTVAEHEAHMDALAAAHPELAQVVTYGDSWLRINGSPNGHRLRAICITKRRPNDCALNPNTDKARFFLMAAIHARELTTSEMAWRWMDYLVENYNVDAEVTALLDYSEMWVVPVANPDARAKVEEGGNAPIMQRKNMNGFPGSCVGSYFDQAGVDLNRNASVGWGQPGSGSDLCDPTYRGVSPSSEPEQYFLENLLRQLFRDQRPEPPTSTVSVPLTATGALITLHSYGNLVLFPWGFTETPAPNDNELRHFGFRLSSFNDYRAGPAPQVLYTASGVTDDWSYGELGIASSTFEIGPDSGTDPCGSANSPTGLAFTPPYTCQDSRFWHENRAAFLYAARLARQPYTLAMGPMPFTPTLTNSLTTMPWVTITVRVSDSAFGGVGAPQPAAQPIQKAELYVDVPPWLGGHPAPLAALDGAFDSADEIAAAPLDVGRLCTGRHTVFVRAQDAAGNWGPTSTAWVQGSNANCVRLYFPLILAQR